MNFGFSQEQDLLRQEVRKFLDEQCPLPEVRRVMATGIGHSPAHWKQLGELGFLGLVIPEEFGGAGLGWEDLVILLEETGRSLFPSPLISTTLAATLLLDLGSESQKKRWLPGIAGGETIAAVAAPEGDDPVCSKSIRLRPQADANGLLLSGEKRFVADAAQADVFLVAVRNGDADSDLSLLLVEAAAPGVSVETVSTLDRTKRVGHLRLDAVRVADDAVLGEAGGAAAAIERYFDRGAAAVTAEIVGAIEGALSITVQFAKDRVQFGRPIGQYQGVKHPLAEIYVDLECSKSLLYYAAWALDGSPKDVPAAVSAAKAFGSEAITRSGIDAIQLHGAVGYTEEYDIQLYLKRSKWARPAFGDEEYHYERVASLEGY
jgi:alkylation response protein AidB-like acyl-CoA dehydrogenase